MTLKSCLLPASLLITGSGLLSGCGGAMPFPDAGAGESTVQSAAGKLSGHIHGGQQPIANAKIYLLAAGTTGYASASTSLLTSSSTYTAYPPQKDTSGNYYVLTDTNGNFEIADTCSSGQQVYVASVGGNPGGGTNTAANEIAVLGACPAAGNFDSALSGVYISEISTVAAAYATSAYALDAFHIGSPSTTAAETGIANAFENASNLFDITNINDRARTTTIYGNGTVPQAKIQAIANILAACVNSSGSSSAACSTLFSNAKANGSSGSTPTDTTMAAINMAHNPWANVSNLFNLAASNPPFPTTMSTAPNDLAISLSYGAASLGNNPSMAIDAGGDLFTAAPGTAAVMKLSPLGKVLSPTTGYSTSGYVNNIRAIALDPNADVFVLGASTSNGTPVAAGAEMSSTGGLYYGYAESPYGTSTHPPTASTNLVMDAAGNLYFSATKTTGGSASTTCCTVKFTLASESLSELDSGTDVPGTNFLAVFGSNLWMTNNTSSAETYTTAASTVSGGGLKTANGVALDSAGNAWFANSGNNSLSKFNSAGTAVSGSTGYTGGGLATPKAVAVDGQTTVWATSSSGSYGLSQFTSAGAAVGSGYSTSGLMSPAAMVLDPSGNLWVGDASSGTVLEYIGLAAPVVTPMVTAVTNGTLGTRP